MPAIAERLPAAAAARPSLLPLLALGLCAPTLVPLFATAWAWTQADADTVAHLARHVLPRASAQSAWLVLGVSAGAALLGTTLAALVALTEFPGRRFYAWALLLPLVLPGYVMAVALIGLFDVAGPVARFAQALGIDAWFEFRSRGGIILTLTLSLYPYVYLVAREAFARQGGRAMEAARVLGLGPWQAFRRAALPMARPAIVAGTLLVAMETLADFGTAAAFNHDTLTTAIYKAWFGLQSVEAALRIGGVLLLCVLAIALAEARWRAPRRYTAVGGTPVARIALGRGAILASAGCALVLACALVVPVARLAWSALPRLTQLDARWLVYALDSALLGAGAALLTVAAALAIEFAARERPGVATAAAQRLAGLGYGLPGALLAVGLYVPIMGLSNRIADATGIDVVLHGGLALLLLAYGVRFTAVAQATVGSALARVRPAVTESARTLGAGPARLATAVYAPLLRGGLVTGALLVFVDTIKEMPITLMMRPFGWDTLATRLFELTSEGQWADASVPALAIGVAGILPVWWLERRARDEA